MNQVWYFSHWNRVMVSFIQFEFSYNKSETHHMFMNKFKQALLHVIHIHEMGFQHVCILEGYKSIIINLCSHIMFHLWHYSCHYFYHLHVYDSVHVDIYHTILRYKYNMQTKIVCQTIQDFKQTWHIVLLTYNILPFLTFFCRRTTFCLSF